LEVIFNIMRSINSRFTYLLVVAVVVLVVVAAAVRTLADYQAGDCRNISIFQNNVNSFEIGIICYK